MNGIYLLTFFLVVVVGNPSWDYVESMNWTIFDGEGLSGGWLLLRAPSMHRCPVKGALDMCMGWGVCTHQPFMYRVILWTCYRIGECRIWCAS
jgi:hypothetical protein